MRCKMCGAKLKKQGDICKNCYQKYKKQENLKIDNEEKQLSIGRKYSPKFNLLKNGEIIVVLLLVSLSGFSSFGNVLGFLITLLCVIFFGLLMFYNKKRALGTKTEFYETKFKYIRKYPLQDSVEIISYGDIKDMAYFQSKSQKMCGIGDIRFYTKGFLSGITIKDIPDVKENFNEIKKVIVSNR